MKKKYFIITIINIVIVVVVCNYFYDRYNWFEVAPINPTRPIERLKKLVVENNDDSDYSELHQAYYGETDSNEFLFYALLKANKFHNKRGYYNVYIIFNLIDRYQKIKLDNETINLMIEYLKKGAALNDEQSKFDLGHLYMEGKYVPKDTVLGQWLINTSGFLE